MSGETVSPVAPEAGLYPNRWAPLKEQNIQLKQDLQAKEEELTLYKRKAASWKRVHVKKVLLHMLMPQGKISLTLYLSQISKGMRVGHFSRIFTTELSITLPNLFPIT